MAQARRDLAVAQQSLDVGAFEWAAFQSQQAAEKALKALLHAHLQDAIGHTLIHLLQRLKALPDVASPAAEVESAARELDRHYVLARYPNGYAAGYPAQFYDERAARAAVGYATEIHRYVEPLLSPATGTATAP